MNLQSLLSLSQALQIHDLNVVVYYCQKLALIDSNRSIMIDPSSRKHRQNHAH